MSQCGSRLQRRGQLLLHLPNADCQVELVIEGVLWRNTTYSAFITASAFVTTVVAWVVKPLFPGFSATKSVMFDHISAFVTNGVLVAAVIVSMNLNTHDDQRGQLVVVGY